jgi:hypothetical protein
MDERILNKVCSYQQNPEKLLSCCKNFTLERIRNIRWKNRIYFRDNRIKLVNCEDTQFYFQKCKEIWYKNGKKHCDDINPNTGLKFHAVIWRDGKKIWCKDGKQHRDEIDQDTGLTLPAIIKDNGSKVWFKDGEQHRDEIDPVTGITLPAKIMDNEYWSKLQSWYKEGLIHRYDIDPETGLTFPALICADKNWWKDGKRHCDDIDPDTGIVHPAIIFWNGSKFWYKDGIEFNTNFERVYLFFSKNKNILFLSIGVILYFLYFIH